MSGEAQLSPEISDATLQALLQRAIRNTLILGVLAGVALAISTGWQTGALFLVGALISAAGIFEWQRLVGVINAKIRNHEAPRGSSLTVTFVALRLVIFGAAIYVSLNCLQGHPLALVFGLGLAVATLTWEALRLLRA